jgi:hypothetical protein
MPRPAWAQGDLFEYSGFSALDVTASRSFTAGTTQISSGSATTTVPGDLIVGWMFGSGCSGIQPGSGFTIEATTAPEAFEDRVDQTTGAVSATFTEPSWTGSPIAGSVVISRILLMKSLNAKVVLYQASAALKSIQVTPTLSFP